MATKKPPIKNQILADYLINSSHDAKSIGGLVVSGIVSTFGVYTQFKTNGSTEFQILKQNAKSGETTANNYTLELQAWRFTLETINR